jgi:hypothetical protein
VPRANVGDIGFDIGDVDLAMSEISLRLLRHLDVERVRDRRIGNYRRLASALAGRARPLHRQLPEGACPLFFPIMVENKPETAEVLRGCGIDVLEFWNHGAEAAGFEPRDLPRHSCAPYLRQHVLGLPIHQDLTPRHIDHLAEHVGRLHARVA